MTKKMFKKPGWLRPEINEFKYWVHLLILVLVVYFLINTFVEPMGYSLRNIGLGIVFLAIADIIAHTLLKLD